MTHFQVGTNDIVIEDRLADKLGLMCDRVTKEHPALDACLENSGGEGEGKTNASIIEAAYIKHKIKRPIALFFKTSSCIKYMQSHSNSIVILDEPSFESLSMDAISQIGKDFLRLTSTMRVKRHFFIINFAKFWKFPEFLVVDRALGMVHMHTRHGTALGRFLYIRKKNLERLWNDYKRFGRRNFGKLKSFGGGFGYMMEKIFADLDIQVENTPHATFKDYMLEKDRAIGTIGDKKSKKDNKAIKEMKFLKFKISNMYKNSKTIFKNHATLAQYLGYSTKSIEKWRYYSDEDPSVLEKEDFEPLEEPITNNSLEDEPLDAPKEEKEAEEQDKELF